jgi:hypothetical protein
MRHVEQFQRVVIIVSKLFDSLKTETLFDSYSLSAFGFDTNSDLFDKTLGNSDDWKSPENLITQQNPNRTKILRNGIRHKHKRYFHVPMRFDGNNFLSNKVQSEYRLPLRLHNHLNPHTYRIVERIPELDRTWLHP